MVRELVAILSRPKCIKTYRLTSKSFLEINNGQRGFDDNFFPPGDLLFGSDTNTYLSDTTCPEQDVGNIYLVWNE